MLFRKTLFNVESEEVQYGGFTADEHWNGWECPYFEKAVAEKILTDYSAMGDDNVIWWFDDNNQCFYLNVSETDPGLNDMWSPQRIKVDGVELVVYAIGAQNWRWDETEVDNELFDGICPNCTSEMLVKQQNIRGVIRKFSDSRAIEIVDYTVTLELFTECEDCGHRWEDVAK